jgi:hypothetical protein
MWPFSEMSLSAATLVGAIANWGLLACLVGGVLSTFVIVKTADVKEEHWAEARRVSDEAISKTNVNIAEANARAKEAELKLEQVRERMRARHIKGESFLKILEGKPKTPVEILFVRDDGEAFQLSLEIRDFLKRATWSVEEPRYITQEDVSPRLERNHPYTMAAGGQPQGVSLFLRAESQADFEREAEKNPLDPDRPLDTPRKALGAALLDSLGTLSGGMSYENGRPGVLRVIVGPKPQLN